MNSKYKFTYRHDGNPDRISEMEVALGWDVDRKCYMVKIWTDDVTDANRLPWIIKNLFERNIVTEVAA